MDTNLILGLVTAAGAGLSGAVAKMWTMFHNELKECKEDRKALHARTDELHEKITDISTTVGRLEGQLLMKKPSDQ